MIFSKVHTIAAGGASTSATGMVEELSQPRDSQEELPFPTPQLGEIQGKFHPATLVTEVIANIVAVITGTPTPTPTIIISVSSGVMESFVATPVDGTLVAKPTLEVTVMQDSAFTSSLEAPAVTSEMRTYGLTCAYDFRSKHIDSGYVLRPLRACWPPLWNKD